MSTATRHTFYNKCTVAIQFVRTTLALFRISLQYYSEATAKQQWKKEQIGGNRKYKEEQSNKRRKRKKQQEEQKTSCAN